MNRRHLPILLGSIVLLALVAACGAMCFVAVEAHQRELALLCLLPLLGAWFVWERLTSRIAVADHGQSPVIIRDSEVSTQDDEFLHFHDEPRNAGRNGEK